MQTKKLWYVIVGIGLILARSAPRLLAVAVLAENIVAVRQLSAQEPESLKARVLVEVPQAWDRYRKFSEKLQGKATATQRWQNAATGKRMEGKTYYEVKRNKDCASWMVQFLGEARSDGRVEAVNPKYAFQIKRNGPERDWFVDRVEVGGDGASFGGKPVGGLVADLAAIGYKVEGVPLPELLTKGTEYKLQQVTAVQRQGVDAVRLEFDSSHPVKRLPFSPVQGGEVFLDPSHDWHVLEYNLRAEWGDGKGIITQTVAYRRTDGAMDVPETARYIIHNHSNPALESEMLYEFDLQEMSNLPPDREFTLSAYGLPEPAPFTQGATPWYLWAAILGFVCLGLAALLRGRGRRARSPAAP